MSCSVKKKKDKKDKFCVEFDRERDCPTSCCPKPVVMECQNVSGVTLPILTADLINGAPAPTTVGTISADLSCFCRPCVKLDFSAVVVLPLIALAVGGEIIFRIFRSCNGQNEVQVGSFNFPQPVLAADIGGSDSIHFTFCDCPSCPAECCSYRITVETTSVGAAITSYTINQGTIAITVAERC